MASSSITLTGVRGQLSASPAFAARSPAKAPPTSASQLAFPSCDARALHARPQQLRVLVTPESRKRYPTIAKASKTQVEPSEAVSDVLKTVQEAWEKTDDKLAVGGLGVTGLIVLWASTGLLSAIDKLPIIPDFFEFIGVVFSVWFACRYLLFKPDREELLKTVNEAKGKITGE